MVAAAGLAAASPSAGAGAARGLEAAVTAALAALTAWAGETGAAVAGGARDEASVVSLVSKDPGSGGRCLNDRKQLHLPQTDILNKILPRKKHTPISLAGAIPQQGPICGYHICNSPIPGVHSTGVHF